MEQMILSAIMQRMKDAQVIRPSQHGFMRGRSYLTNLISFYDKVTRLVDEGKAVDVVYLDFSKAFDTVSHRPVLLTVRDPRGRTILQTVVAKGSHPSGITAKTSAAAGKGPACHSVVSGSKAGQIEQLQVEMVSTKSHVA
ncbi:rna-directed dna polymerase from mobile element jockey-like [Limosa lapponica baueri]|uniref:Rna-directed dna polymerase from mobile element jockey-like n=1 Tax=Limosa lapponica baueri TaxID=1758121 RepID=A0A2I0TG87_LIMLA|nr:rna-directed dna polymerase from mobile element jockey-like [Limosa lapponica baueri]